MKKELIYETLDDWNYWEKELPGTFDRIGYTNDISSKASTEEMIFIKGVRRSGKSTLLVNHIKNLLKSGIDKNRILFVNFEDPRFSGHLTLEFLEEIKKSYLYYRNPTDTPYLFLDEIQNVNNFEKWMLKEYELKISHLFATGSNSKLLSREIGSSLSGRYLDVEVYPLSFSEFLEFKNIKIKGEADFIHHKVAVSRYFEEYMKFGGFPKVVLTVDKEQKSNELKSYFDSILLRDIVARYNLDNFKALEQLSVILLSSISNLVSVNSLKSTLSSSYDLINAYIEYLENAFMLFRMPKFDWSLKKQQANPKKVYSIDTGLSNRVSFQVGRKVGDLLENIVFLELKRMKKNIYYYKTKSGFEVDFLAKENENVTELIQVAASISNKKTRQREIRALISANKELEHISPHIKLKLLTLDDSETIVVDGKKIEILNLLKWLVNKESK